MLTRATDIRKNCDGIKAIDKACRILMLMQINLSSHKYLSPSQYHHYLYANHSIYIRPYVLHEVLYEVMRSHFCFWYCYCPSPSTTKLEMTKSSTLDLSIWNRALNLNYKGNYYFLVFLCSVSTNPKIFGHRVTVGRQLILKTEPIPSQDQNNDIQKCTLLTPAILFSGDFFQINVMLLLEHWGGGRGGIPNDLT